MGQYISSLFITREPALATKGTESASRPNAYVHPNVYLTHDPIKGAGTASEVDLNKGTLIFIDNPYAIIPTVALGTDNQLLLCSRLQCSRKVVHKTTAVSCANKCTAEVVWCSTNCKNLGREEHDFECSWLRTHAKSIRQEYLEEDFYTLWLVVRTLAQHHFELSPLDTGIDWPTKADKSFNSDWNVICRLRSNQDTLQPQKLGFFRTLVSKYLVGKHTMLPDSLDAEEMLTLVCRVAMNNYDLWSHGIGIWPPPSHSVNREQSYYAFAMYLRTPFLNHSCIPNLMHQPDEDGRMVFHAARDIAAGEELSLAYFDLAEPKYMDVKKRQAYLESEYRFTCVCPRCVLESGEIEGETLHLELERHSSLE